MTRDEGLASLSVYLDRLCIYIEDGVFSVARLTTVDASDESLRATIEAVPGCSLVCHYRENPPRFAEETHPIGDRWEVSQSWKWFGLNEGYWDGSVSWGFRIFFIQDVIDRFLDRDLSWIDDYF